MPVSQEQTALDLAQDWLGSFDRAVTAGDPQAVAALFRPDGYWRDIVSFTWHLRTYTGTDEIGAAFAATLPDTKPHAVALRTSTPPRWVCRAGVDTVEVLFDFATAHGRGSGVVRLLPDGGGRPRAWSVATTLQELAGFEERIGERRPHGTGYSRTFGGRNWLDERVEARRYDDREPVVLVVGGGQAGLGIAARLGRLGVDTLVVDRGERIGDNWRLRYHSLALHNQTWVCHLPYMPFPDSWPTFIPKDMLANWFESYVDAMEINYWTSTDFVGATRDDDGRWSATVRRDGAERVLRPRHIVMATGVSGVPDLPHLDGLDEFGGEVLHSSGYGAGSDHAGRRALVIGTGNSGHDVAQDLHSYGASVTMVQRSPTTVAHAEPTAQKVYALYSEGLPTEDADLVLLASPPPVVVRNFQLATDQMKIDDADLIAGLDAIGFRQDWGSDGTGFQMKYWRRGGGYYLNVGCSELLISGEIGLLQNHDIDRFVADGVRLRTGETRRCDLVVLATGYESQIELVRRCFGDDVAGRVGQVWGIDDEGELAGLWKRSGQPGLWFNAGSLAQNRIFSRFLALQIKAVDEGLIDPVPPRPAV